MHPIQHVVELLIERPGIGALVAEPEVGDPEISPQFRRAAWAEDFCALLPEPAFKVVGHGLQRRWHRNRHRSSADKFRPEPGLGVEIGTRQINQASLRWEAKIIAPDTAAVLRAGGRTARLAREIIGSCAGFAGVIIESKHDKNLGGVECLRGGAGRGSANAPVASASSVEKSLGRPCPHGIPLKPDLVGERKRAQRGCF
jgi:hypothetical protein